MKEKEAQKKVKIPPDIQTLLFISMAFFGIATIVVIWFVQSKLINTFYRNAKFSEIEAAIEYMENADSEFFEKACYLASYNYKLCVRLFSADDSLEEELTSDYSADCVIHKLPESSFEKFYNKTAENGGIYTEDISSSDILLSESLNSNYSANIIYCKIINTGENKYFLVLDALKTPASSISSTIGNQFILIMMIMIIATFVITLFLSRKLSTPLSRMNQSARQLALGNYDVKFEGNECKETYELSNALNFAAKELSKSDALQKELIANVSHDLRTPLTLIRGYAEVMRDIPGENSPENIQIIIDETNHLSSLVSDMLNLSRIESGEISPSFAEFSITDAILEISERYKKFTDKNGYTLEFIYDCNAFVKADKTMILQVLYNFINNAINYSLEKKEVVIKQITDNFKVTISVIDKGQGIEEDKLQFIWDRYYKIDKNHDRPKIGSGLGLSISKQILKKHAASFGVESKVGEGSRFYFSLPITKALEIKEIDKNI